MHDADTKLIVALDMDTLNQALDLVQSLGDTVSWYKVGKQLFTRHGPEAVTALKELGKHVFLDLKYHDIPNTVAKAIASAANLGAELTTVHASGGPAMLRAAAEAAANTELTVVAVTVLTSMDDTELNAVGVDDTPQAQVQRLAALAKTSGVPGVVSSALEIELIHDTCGQEFILVVPGIRPAGSSYGDQKRVMTPSQAATLGATYIVVGRPITAAPDPQVAARSITAELRS